MTKKSYNKNMVDAKADWLYELPQWNNIFTPERKRELYKEQKNSGTVRKERKLEEMILVHVEAGKSIKNAAVNSPWHQDSLHLEF